MAVLKAQHSAMKFFLSIILVSSITFLYSQTPLTATLNAPGNAGIMSEACGSYELVLHRSNDNTDTIFVFISAAGTATIGVDYTFTSFPTLMLPEDSILVIPINVVNDGSPEGLETVFIEIAFLAGTEDGFITLETAIVDEFEVEIQTDNDTIVWCRDVPYVLLATSEAEITWAPSEFFDDFSGTAATVRPFESQWYYATVGDEDCGARDSVYFDLAIVEINADSIYICLGESAILEGSIEGLATEFTWTPNDTTLSDPSVLTPTATPSVTTTYTLQSDIGVCTAIDRVVVKVDSLPQDLHIDIAPLKPYYCAGEIVALFSPSYDTLHFPDLTFSWGPPEAHNTFLSDLDLLNAALQLQDTTLYIRENINNACESMDSILINVVPPGVPLSVSDTMLCPGEIFTVTVLSDQVTDPEWSPATGLSCTQCLSPTVTVTGNPGEQLLYEFSGMILDCPVGASLFIQIPEELLIQVTGDNVVCEGESVQLGIANPEELTNVVWSIGSGNATLSCTACINPVVTVNETGPIGVFVIANTDNVESCGARGGILLQPGVTDQFSGGTFRVCLGDTVSVFVDRDDVFNLEWSVLSGNAILSCTQCESPVVTLNSDQALLRFFGETTLPGFCNVSGTVLVQAYPDDTPSFLFDPNPSAGPIGQGTEVTITVSGAPPVGPFMWTINGASVPGTSNMNQFNANEEVNVISVKFTNSFGCEQTFTDSLATVPPSYMIPNAFSPDNGDEVNDNFRIIITGDIEIVEFLVFNRWGQLVYEAPENDLAGWDGRFKNEPAASETYVYSAKLRYPDGRTDVVKGDVVLLR